MRKPIKWGGMLHVEARDQIYMLGQGETLTLTDDNGDRICTLQAVGPGSVRLYPGNTFREARQRAETNCASCGELYSNAWGTPDTFVCPDCMSAASEQIAMGR